MDERHVRILLIVQKPGKMSPVEPNACRYAQAEDMYMGKHVAELTVSERLKAESWLQHSHSNMERNGGSSFFVC